jgi:hypothetical protein
LFETHSARLVDAFINHPSIRPTIEQGTHRLTSDEFLSDERNLVFASENGLIILVHREPGILQVHLAFLPEGRGAPMVKSCREVMDLVFERGTTRIIAEIPNQLRAPKLACRRLGFKSLGPDDTGLQEVFSLERDDYGRNR